MTVGCDYEFCFMPEIWHTNGVCVNCRWCEQRRREQIAKESEGNGQTEI